jgi:hypothetical protein
MTRYREWNYSGDINLEYGGLFWREDGADDYVCAVEVTPCSEAGGPNNAWWVEEGTIYLPTDQDKRKRALDCIGANVETATRAELVEACRAYAGIERDRSVTLCIGKLEDSRERVSPDVTLRGNASLERYVKREFLR